MLVYKMSRPQKPPHLITSPCMPPLKLEVLCKSSCLFAGRRGGNSLRQPYRMLEVKKQQQKSIFLVSSCHTYRGRCPLQDCQTFPTWLALAGSLGPELTPCAVSPSSLSRKPSNYKADFVSSAARRLSDFPLSLLPTSCHHLQHLSLFKHLNSLLRALRVSAKSKAKKQG